MAGKKVLLAAPLDRMILAQPFGVNYKEKGWYADAYDPGGARRSRGEQVPDIHDGFDFEAPMYTPIRAPIDGDLYFRDSNGEKEAYLRNKELGLELHFGHIASTVRADGPVMKGEPVMLSGDSSSSGKVGPHVHFGVRQITYGPNGDGPYIVNQDNGTNGFVDPTEFFADEDWFDRGKDFKRPVDRRYGANPKATGDIPTAQMAQIERIVQNERKMPLTDRERNAIQFGKWDLETVIEPSMFPIWSQMSKPEAIKRKVISQ